MSERRKTITWNLAGLFSLSSHKILILLSYFSVHNSVNLAWAAENNEAEWLCPRRVSPLGVWKASWCFAHTHQRSLFHSSSWIVIYFCTFPFSHPAFCEHLHLSGMELHPNKTQGRKATRLPTLQMLRVKTLALGIIELDLHLMPKSPLKHHQLLQPSCN